MDLQNTDHIRGKEWATVAHFDSPQGAGWKEHSFSPRTARYWRLMIRNTHNNNNNNGSWQAQLCEIKLCGATTPWNQLSAEERSIRESEDSKFTLVDRDKDG